MRRGQGCVSEESKPGFGLCLKGHEQWSMICSCMLRFHSFFMIKLTCTGFRHKKAYWLSLFGKILAEKTLNVLVGLDL